MRVDFRCPMLVNLEESVDHTVETLTAPQNDTLGPQQRMTP